MTSTATQLSQHAMHDKMQFALVDLFKALSPTNISTQQMACIDSLPLSIRELAEDFVDFCGENHSEDAETSKEFISVDVITGNASQLLIGCLAKSQEKPVDDIMLEVYGTKYYRPDQHDNKLAKLLVQTNHVYSEKLRVFRRGPVVKLEAQIPIKLRRFSRRWHQLKMSHISLTDFFAKASPAWESCTPQQVSVVSAQKTAQKPLARRDLQQIWGCSPASVNRKLSQLMLKNKATRIGTGKGTKYLIATDSVLMS